jgi:hypothetical protein
MALAILKGAGLALVACSLGQVMALPEEPTCFVTGRGYNDPKRNNTPNGLYQLTALLCQQLCNRTVYCDRFTWYNNSLGCWLQGAHDQEIESPHAVSGPVVCPKKTDTVTEPGNTSAVTDREFTVDPETPEKKEDGGFPWWILILALLALLALGAAAWYCMNSGEKKKKKKTLKKEIPAAREMEEGAPLVAAGAAAAPAAAAAPLQAASVQYAPTVQAAAPMMMTSGASVASPVAYTVAAPAMNVVAAPQYSYQQTASRQMMMPIAQPMQAAPVQMVATQPAAAANDLFNQFDANGDGVLSREEMAAGMASLQQQQ